MSKVYWTTESVKILINSYEMQYDTKHQFYSNKHARADALIKLTDDIKPNMPEITIEDAKKKIIFGLNLRMKTIKFAKEKVILMSRRKQQESLQEHELSQQHELDQEAATSSGTSEIIAVAPKVTKRRKVAMEDSDPVMDKAIATLHNLDKTIQNSTICASPKNDSNIFAEYVAQELQVIDDLELLNDAKHEINVLYNYKKKYLTSKKNKESKINYLDYSNNL
ncbi:hypothetical protein FQA39_LY16908 [Lamprigera yunnana]|nr:hypothetical protein FQA39_LY16908 [Lamprigera yunnana]